MRKCDYQFLQITDEANSMGLAAYELLEMRALANLSVEDFVETVRLRQKMQRLQETTKPQ